MEQLREFLSASYTAYQATENCVRLLQREGFTRLSEGERWTLREGGKYFTVRGGSSLAAFRYSAKGGFKLVASHTDSPSFKLKESALSDALFTRLDTEPYGGALGYTFFDRPLRLAGRAVYEENGRLLSKPIVSDFCVVLPSLAIHMHRDANEKFSVDPQKELPLLSLGKTELEQLLGDPVSYDLFAVPDEPPFVSGAHGEFFSSPRLDDLTGVLASLTALCRTEGEGTNVAVCFDSEEIGSGTRQGAGSDFLRAVLARIAEAQGRGKSEHLAALGSSLLVSLDNAHSVHPNHPELCDPANRAVMGGGVVIKSHAGGAYTTDALTSAVVKRVLARSGVKCQSFFNRSDLKSGSTLGAVSLRQVGVPSVDIGIAQLAMHSAVETMAIADYEWLKQGLCALYAAPIRIGEDGAQY